MNWLIINVFKNTLYKYLYLSTFDLNISHSRFHNKIRYIQMQIII